MSAEPKAKADSSTQLPAVVVATATPAPAPTVDAVVFKVIGALALSAAFFVGGAYGISDRAEKMIDRRIEMHEAHPHKQAATKADVARLERILEKILEKL